MAKIVKSQLEKKITLDIHSNDKRIAACLRRIENDLSQENITLIKKYHKAMKLETIATATQLKHLEVLLNLSRYLKKDWVTATVEDIQDLVIHFMELYSSNGQESNTSSDHKKVINQIQKVCRKMSMVLQCNMIP